MIGSVPSVILAAIVAGFLVAPLSAQQHEGTTIAAVTVTGLRHIKEAVVLEQIESRPGLPYRQAVADQDVVRLDRLGVFSDITMTPVNVGDALHVNVAVVETLRVLPVLSIAVTDENGTSLGPSLRLLSLRGRPHEISLTARFGGSTLFEFSEASPELTRAPFWQSAKLAFRERYNKLDEFNERSIDLDTRAGVRTSERFKAGAIFQVYQVRSDQAGITLSPDDVDTLVSVGAVADYDGRNSRRDTSHGWWNSADALWRTGTGGYATLDIDVRRYQRLARRHGLVGDVAADASVRRGRCRPFIHRLRLGWQQHGERVGIQLPARQESVHQLDGVSLHGRPDQSVSGLWLRTLCRAGAGGIRRRRYRLE